MMKIGQWYMPGPAKRVELDFTLTVTSDRIVAFPDGTHRILRGGIEYPIVGLRDDWERGVFQVKMNDNRVIEFADPDTFSVHCGGGTATGTPTMHDAGYDVNQRNRRAKIEARRKGLTGYPFYAETSPVAEPIFYVPIRDQRNQPNATRPD